MRLRPGGGGRRPDRAGIGRLTAALDRLLRPALEAAVAVARAGEEATPAVPCPVHLRPFLQFAKLPAKALDATRRAIDTDEEFRQRVAEVVTEDDVGRAGWLWLTRPPGWEEELESIRRDVTEAGAAAAERRAENEARRRLAGAEAAVARAEATAAAAAAEAARAAATLAEERRARRIAAQEVDDLARRVEEVSAERDRARADRDRARAESTRAHQRASEAEQALEELRAGAPAPVSAEVPAEGPAAAPPADHGAVQLRAAATALSDAATAAARMAARLQGAAVALGVEPPSDDPAQDRAGGVEAAAPAAPPARLRRPKVQRRTPAALPPGILDDSVEAAEHLMRVPGMTLVVDGYNASLTAWPGLPIAEQRRRLVDALAELAARTGVDASVVFDGADTAWPAAAATTARAVKVAFSPADVEADDVILARVAGLGPSRPVLVASSDRRVRDGAEGMGANVISSAQLVAALRR